ncbi:YxeA family protein [Paenibacillus sp. 102]|uniref:YxeA family protein n=1 Tax=Paenibacillus sp. 102 TaxID=3120823 RepID=UPI0031B9EE4C
MKKFIVIALLLIVGIGAFLMKGGVMVDRLNPLVKMDDYYTVVKADGKHLGKDSIREDSESYEYNFKGFDSNGKEQDITINVTKKLRHGAYLKVTAKGQNGKSWMEVQPNEIPDAAKAKLELK